MSEYESKKGTLTFLKNGTRKSLIKELVENGEISIPDYYNIEEDYNDIFYDMLDEEYYVNEKKQKIYKIFVENIDPYIDIYECEEIDIDKFNFFVKYYNGGCSFSEALDEAMEKEKSKSYTREDIKLIDIEELWKNLRETLSLEEHRKILEDFKRRFNLTEDEILEIQRMKN